MDNCSHNSEKLQNAIITIAKEWEKKGFVASQFLDYLLNKNQVSFSWTRIDKITPHSSNSIFQQLTNIGNKDMQPIITSQNTYIAPFVNDEEPQY